MTSKLFKPILMHTEKLNVLVIGYGRIGKRKAHAYLKSGARVNVVSPDSESDNDAIVYYNMCFSDFIISHSEVFLRQHLVVICTDDAAENTRIQDKCEASYKLFNRIDNASESLYSDMLFDQEDYHVIAVSGNGFSPYVSKFILDHIKAKLQGVDIKKRIKILYQKTPFMKKHHIPYEKIKDYDNEILERIDHGK